MSASSLVRAAIALLALCAAGAARAAPADKVQAFAAFVTDERASAKLPALAVGVANREGVVTVAQSGVRDRERGGQVRPGDRYHLGSITKSMTATMVARLVDAGTLRWDSTPAEVWPELAAGMDPAFRTITLEMILRHRAGLPAMESDREVARAPKFAGDARRQRAGFARWLTSARPPHPVGRFLYSNAGYGLAAAMAERAAGASWDELMRREVFAPLQMTSCGFGWPARGEPRGHRYRDGAFAVHDLTDGYRLGAYVAPAGDVHCSVEDMLTYGRAHLVGPEGGDPLLTPATWRKLHDAPVDDYAMGWNIRPFGFHHLGSAGTFTASLIVSPSRDIVVFAATNAAGWPNDSMLFSEVASRAFRDFARPADSL